MAKVNPGQFIREVPAEKSKVTWPSRKETVSTTIMVFVMVFRGGAVLLSCRSGLSRPFGQIDSWALGGCPMAMRWYVRPRLLGLREEGRGVDPRAGANRRVWKTCSRKSWCRPRKSSRCAAGQKGQRRAQVLPRLCAGQDGAQWATTRGIWSRTRPRSPVSWATAGSRARSVEAEAERIQHQVQEGVERPKPSITFEIGETGAGRRRAVHLVQRHGRGSRRGARAAQGGGVHLRPGDARRAGILAGREALAARFCGSRGGGPGAERCGRLAMAATAQPGTGKGR